MGISNTHIVKNTRGHRRTTETLTGRCTICDELTATARGCGRCLDVEPWHLEHFDPHSELTKERDGYREDAIAERHRQEQWGY